MGQDLIAIELLILWFRFYTSCSKQSKFISRLLDVSYIFNVIVNKMPTCWNNSFIYVPHTTGDFYFLDNIIYNFYNNVILQYNIIVWSYGNVHGISSPSSDSCLRNCEALGRVVAP